MLGNTGELIKSWLAEQDGCLEPVGGAGHGGWVRRVELRILTLRGLWDIKVQSAIGSTGVTLRRQI